MTAMSFNEVMGAQSVAKARATTIGRTTAADIAGMVRVAIRKAIGDPVTVPVGTDQPSAPANLNDAIRQHVNGQRRVGETASAALDRLAASGDPVLSQLYAAGRMQRGADTARANAHAAAADAVAKSGTALDAATDVIIAKAAADGRTISRAAATASAIAADPALYAQHRSAHRAARGL